MNEPVLGKGTAGDVRIHLRRLMVSRLMIQANSGSGKSWMLRRLLEQTHGLVQQIVIDLDDEFHARAGGDGDCLAEPRSADLLSRRILELGVSAILGISELKAKDRIRFVRAFLEGLMEVPRKLWRPVLVVVDEAHVFCPQKEEAESAAAVIDLMTRGRKRGFCGVLATQRISKLHKDALAEANNKLIGRAALDVDMLRAGSELGFSGREDLFRLRTLKPGHFFAFGPALSDQVLELQVGAVRTTHPEPGQQLAPVPAPKAKVLKVLEKLKDVPKEAQQELRTAEDLRARVRALEGELRQAKRATPPPQPVLDPKVIEKAQARGMELARRESAGVLKASEARQLKAFRLAQELSRILEPQTVVGSAPSEGRAPAPRPAPRLADFPVRLDPKLPKDAVLMVSRKASGAPLDSVAATGDPITGPEQRILDAIAWLESIGNAEPEITAVAFLAGYSAGGGAFNNPRGHLRSLGMIEYRGNRLALTEAGRALARPPEGVLTTEELHRRVLERLPGPEQKLLRALLEAYPRPMSNEDLAAATGYAPSGGAFNNPRGRLKTLGLVEYPSQGQVRAREILFLS